MARVIAVAEGDYTVVTYDTGTVRRYQPDRVPVTVRKWLADQTQEPVEPVPAVNPGTVPAVTACSDGAPSADPATKPEPAENDSILKKSAFCTDRILDRWTDPAGSQGVKCTDCTIQGDTGSGFENRGIPAFDFSVTCAAELSLLVLAGTAVYAAWWTVRAAEITTLAAQIAAKTACKAWGRIIPGLRQKAAEMAGKMACRWQWRAELLQEAAA